MSVGRKRRRADGKLRPSVRRYRQRKRAAGGPFIDPAAGDRFFALALSGTQVWVGADLLQLTGIGEVDLGRVLERVAENARWVKLRDTAGVVRAIAMPRNHPAREGSRSGHRQRMLDAVASLAAVDAAALAAALEHCRRVADGFDSGSVEARVAIYHDHLEDGAGDVPAEIRRHVEVLTRGAVETYDDYIARIKASGDAVAIAVKIADLRDNLARCRGEHGGHIKPYLAPRYERALLELEPVLAG